MTIEDGTEPVNPRTTDAIQGRPVLGDPKKTTKLPSGVVIEDY